MPITLSQLQTDQPNFVDVPCPGTTETFRLHRLSLSEFLEMQTTFTALIQDGLVDENGDSDVEAIAPKITPLIAKSLGGDWDTSEGMKYLSGRIDLLTILLPAIVDLYTSIRPPSETTGETDGEDEQDVAEPIEDTVKND